MTTAASKRISHGLSLPQAVDSRDSVVNNILSSLATLDETTQLQWIQETSRQVDDERAYQRSLQSDRNNSMEQHRRYDHHDTLRDYNIESPAPVTGVGYRERGRTGSFTANLHTSSAPTPTVPMGRTSKPGFFRRFMGIGPKVPLEGDLVIASHSQKPNVLVKSPSASQVRELSSQSRLPPPPPIPEQSRPNIIKKKSSNFFRRRPKSSGDGIANGSPPPNPNFEPPPPLPSIPSSGDLSNHQSTLDTPLTDLRKRLEDYHLPSQSTAPLTPNAKSRPDLRIETSDTHRQHRYGAVETYPSNANHMQSTSTSYNTSSSVKYIGRSPEPNKAKAVMGLEIPKDSSPILHPRAMTPLEKEFADAYTQQDHTPDKTQAARDEPQAVKENGLSNGVSVDLDRVKETAKDIYDGTQVLVALGDASRWLMETGEFNNQVRIAYMELFDFVGVDILTAVRRLCARLLLKGESQQLDRILEALAKRWYESNSENGMKDPDVVHALAYSIFLLNTDLHIVDYVSSQRMTRSQFVRNTMATVLNQLPKPKRISTAPPRLPSAPKGKLTQFPSASSPNLSHLSPPTSNLSRSGSLLRVGQSVGMARNPSAQSLDHGVGRVSRDSTRTNGTVEKSSWSLHDDKIGPYGGMAALGSHSAWEAQMECHLKEIYSSVKNSPLQQAHGAPTNDSNASMNLKPGVGVGLDRSASILSHSSHVSDSGSTKGSRVRNLLSRSKSQPRLPLHPQESYISITSDRSSLDERAKSPPNIRQPRSSSHGRTPSNISMESLNAYSHDHGSSIGFANSLSQTIIREENHSSTASFIDEEFQEHALILSGPPWAKEGVLKSKRHLDLNHKKSKDKQWTEAFVVIDKGQMRLFQFENHKVYHPSHQVGGGNWQKNANMIGSFLLRQTMAAALPPPGYSKSRQYVWMLTLPSGAVFVFEAGTQELVKEWVSCANYWAARTSKEPLKAAVSNMEWGWGDCLISSDDDVTDDGRSVTESNPRSTFEAQRSPVSNGKATYGGDSRALKGDRVLIREWKPPQPSLMASSLKERDQLQALESFLKQLEEEIDQHNNLRYLMSRSFTPRHPNGLKAQNNWERKSQYLIQEIVKYKTYVEILSRALAMREELIRASAVSASTTPKEESHPIPEPWFDLHSAPASVSTVKSREVPSESDEHTRSG